MDKQLPSVMVRTVVSRMNLFKQYESEGDLHVYYAMRTTSEGHKRVPQRVFPPQAPEQILALWIIKFRTRVLSARTGERTYRVA